MLRAGTIRKTVIAFVHDENVPVAPQGPSSSEMKGFECLGRRLSLMCSSVFAAKSPQKPNYRNAHVVEWTMSPVLDMDSKRICFPFMYQFELCNSLS
jgi:hypothetical protein